MSDLKYYFDENVEAAVSEQLLAAGFDVVSVRRLEKLGDTDINHLQRATEMQRILCTYDTDFLVLANEGVQHAGIIFAQQQQTYVGTWVKGIRLLHTQYQAEDVQNLVIFLPSK